MSLTLVQQGASSLGAALAVSGASIVAVQVARRRPIVGSTLAKRWMTWAILAPLWLAAAAWAPGRVFLLSAFAVVAAIEFGKLDRSMVTSDRWLLGAWGAISVPAASLLGLDPLVLVASAAVTSLVVPLLAQDIAAGPRRIGGVTVGVVFVVLPFVVLDGVAADIGGAAFLTLGLAVALSDVMAFVLGSTVGRRRISPIVSPNKTIAGLFGNFVGATIGVAMAVVVGFADAELWWIAPVVAVGSVTGDLLVSLMKRHRSVKDAGSWLPGFGGLLDRVDSLLMSALLVFVVSAVIGGAL